MPDFFLLALSFTSLVLDGTGGGWSRLGSDACAASESGGVSLSA
jgi:hypothetical protein